MFSRLPRTAAGFTTNALGIRFVFIGSRVCSALPSDPMLRSAPLRFSNRSPPSGSVRSFHPQAADHARHKKKRQDASCRSLNSPHCAVGVVAVTATGASVPGSSTVLIFTVARIFSSPLKTFSRSTCVLSFSADVPRPRANS